MPASRNSRVRKLVILAMLIALTVVLSFLKTPPMFGFLQYDASGAIVLLAALLFGPIEGIVVAVLAGFIRLLFPGIGAQFGVMMDIIAYLALVIPAGFLFQRFRKHLSGQLVALIIGVVCMVIMMIVANIVLTPPLSTRVLGYTITRAAVIKMILPAFLPFNVLKAAANSILAFVVYKALARFVF